MLRIGHNHFGKVRDTVILHKFRDDISLIDNILVLMDLYLVFYNLFLLFFFVQICFYLLMELPYVGILAIWLGAGIAWTVLRLTALGFVKELLFTTPSWRFFNLRIIVGLRYFISVLEFCHVFQVFALVVASEFVFENGVYELKWLILFLNHLSLAFGSLCEPLQLIFINIVLFFELFVY